MAQIDGRTASRWTGASIRIAMAYYGLLGLVALGAGGWLLVSTLTALAGQCSVTLSLGGPLLTIGSLDTAFCEQNSDLLGLIAPSLVAGIMLATARRLSRRPPRFGPLVGVGVLLGLAVAALPLLFIVWAMDFYGFPLGVGEIIIFVGPSLWALASASIVAWHAFRRQPGAG